MKVSRRSCLRLNTNIYLFIRCLTFPGRGVFASGSFFFFTRVFFEQISDVIFSTVNHAALLDGGLLFCCLLGWFFYS